MDNKEIFGRKKEPYFAYGSNMLSDRLEKRVGPVEVFGPGTLANHSLRFNKKSSVDESGKANVMPVENSKVFGVLYGLTDGQFDILDGFEGGYERKEMDVVFEGGVISSHTYFVSEEKSEKGLFPTEKYLNFLVLGAREHNLPKEYIDFLEKIKTV